MLLVQHGNVIAHILCNIIVGDTKLDKGLVHNFVVTNSSILDLSITVLDKQSKKERVYMEIFPDAFRRSVILHVPCSKKYKVRWCVVEQ